MKLAACSQPEVVTWSHFQQMRMRLTSRINQELTRETGLSEADFVVLNELIHAENETVRAMALRAGLDWEKSRLSHQIRRMEERDLLQREPCLDDNRGSLIRLTETGRQAALEAIECYAGIVRRRVFDLLTTEQLEALDEISLALLAPLGNEECFTCTEDVDPC